MHLVVGGSVECAAAAAERACVCGLVRLVRSDSVARLRDVRHVLVWGGLCLRWSLVFALVFAVFALVFGLCAGLCGLCAGLCGCLGWSQAVSRAPRSTGEQLGQPGTSRDNLPRQLAETTCREH